VNAERIVVRGSSKPQLQALALLIHRLCRSHAIDLRVVWVSRVDPRIKLADELSRWESPSDPDNYGLAVADFRRLEQAFGPFDIDLFASDDNARCARFASIRCSKRAEFRDAFAKNWASLGNVFAHPPPGLASACIRKLVEDGASGTLVLPRWFTLKGWPLVCADGKHVNSWCTKLKIFFPHFRCGKGVVSKTFCGRARFPVLALRFNGSHPLPFCPRVTPAFCTVPECVLCRK